MLTALVMLATGVPTPPAPLPEGKGEKNHSRTADVAVLSSPDSPFPSGRGAGGLGLAPPPRPAPLRATALDGSALAWPAGADTKAACLLFVGTDCPLANAYAPEIARLAKDYGPKGITFAVVYPLPDLKPDAARKHAKEYAFPCPAVLDADLALAKRLGATVTPEAVVLSPAGAVLYRGRIDDRYPKAGGKRREVPTTFDLRDALDAALAGKAVPKPWPPAVGCHIDLP